jgi:agmatine deiminase
MKISLLSATTTTAWLLALDWCSNLSSCAVEAQNPIRYYWPAEDLEHEATWLQWPHNRGWDPNHIARYEPSWIALTKALHTGERVRIFVYDEREKKRVRSVLSRNSIDLSQIDLYIAPTDDVWIRDNGPIFVFDGPDGTPGRSMVVEDWSFNGWVSNT